MKRILAVLLTVVLMCSVCGCGTNIDDNSVSGNKSPKDIKAGFICIHDEKSTYDKNFIDAAKEACESMNIECEFKTNVPEGEECLQAVKELADSGCNFIFANSYGHEDSILEAAKQYPNIEFCAATGTQAHTADLPNFHNAFASIYEGRYLAGVAAGMKLNEMIEDGIISKKQAKIGYVGSYAYAEVISGYTSFYLGAKSKCPSVTMEVRYTGSWFDPEGEKELAKKLIDDECVIISQHADSMGAPEACEEAGVYNVAYNETTDSSCPNTFLISTKINWAPYFEYALGCMITGATIDTDWSGSLLTGSVEMSYLGTAAAPDTQKELDEVAARIKNGDLKVFDANTFTVDGVTLDSYMADVDVDLYRERDTNVLYDGYFHESEDGVRSAPYFDIQIDGITVVE